MKLTRSYRARCWTVEFGASEAPTGLPPGVALHTPWTMDADPACVITWARERFGIYSAPEVVVEPVGAPQLTGLKVLLSPNGRKRIDS
jgi:hypothetical protein